MVFLGDEGGRGFLARVFGPLIPDLKDEEETEHRTEDNSWMTENLSHFESYD